MAGVVIGTLVNDISGTAILTFILLLVLLTILVANDSNNKNQKKKINLLKPLNPNKIYK